MGYTEIFSSFVVNTSYNDLPSEVIDYTKLLLLDTIGVGLGGFVTKIGRVAIDVMKDLGGKPESTIIGDGEKVSCTNAAYTNAILIEALDYQETHTGAGHVGNAVYPAALAIAERLEASGKDLITAFVTGFEVAARVGLAVNPSLEKYSKVGGSAGWCTLGAATAAGKLLDLNENEIAETIGLAGCSAPVPSAQNWGWRGDKPSGSRPNHWLKSNYCQAATAGIRAALLREKGFVGCNDILDRDTGFWRMISSDRCELDVTIKGLGDAYEILNDNIKHYSSCRTIHTTLDAVSHIIQNEGIEKENIKEIIVKQPWFTYLRTHFRDYRPSELVEAQFSVPYVIAMVILGYKPGPNWFKSERFNNKQVIDLMDKVKIPDMYMKKRIRRATVDIVTMEGRILTRSVEHPRGSKQKPLMREEIYEKFIYLASFVINEDKAKKIIETIEILEKLNNINKLTELLH